jgi:antitoxin PrlF
MILSRITSKAQTTVPRAVRTALGVAPGDRLLFEIDGDEVRLRRAPDSIAANPDLATYTEWADDLDLAYDRA